MGQGGYLTFVNKTPYDWKLGHCHSYQMHGWKFPDVIPAGTRARGYIEWDENIFVNPHDDAGEAAYHVSKWTFQLQARFRYLQIYLQDMNTEQYPSGSQSLWVGSMMAKCFST